MPFEIHKQDIIKVIANFEQLDDLNVEFFESAKLSLLDPLGLYLANDVKWIKLNQNWNSLKFPVVIGGKGQPILLLHGFDSSFLEFRRIYKSLKRNFQVIVPDLLGFGFSPRCATNEYNSSKIISHLIDLLKTCLLYTSPSPRDPSISRMPSSA